MMLFFFTAKAELVTTLIPQEFSYEVAQRKWTVQKNNTKMIWPQGGSNPRPSRY